MLDYHSTVFNDYLLENSWSGDGSIMEGFPSGQRDQTVNLPALPSKVRILPPPPLPNFSPGS